ncbi:MAG: hypothetical protein NC344_09740 [Bacteroidales bacterium]|nr:hypothetical protein [Bacteroidales bacterium]MCM1148086.1 hypothetical protein [Bacteroidales bacterium]MCM1509458.1 hypothetical protein [Clostridium sp.]
MKTIKATEMSEKHDYMRYEVNGKEYDVTGEFYYNRKKERFEHTHVGARDGEYLIVYRHAY